MEARSGTRADLASRPVPVLSDKQVVHYRDHGWVAPVDVLSEEEADAVAIALSMVFGTEVLDEVFSTALMYYKKETD